VMDLNGNRGAALPKDANEAFLQGMDTELIWRR
jgi:hypothetical protein